MPTQLTDLVVDYVSLVDRAAVRDPVNQSDPMRFLLWKRETHPHHGGDRMTPEEQKAALEKAQADQKAADERATKAEADLAKAQEQIGELTKSVDELKKATGEKEEPKPVDKSEWPESARLAFEKAEQERAADRERAEKAEADAKEASEIAKAERDTRLTREFLAKAESYKALVVKVDTFGPVLREITEKCSKETAAEIDRVLKAADEGLQKSELFKTLGGNDPAGDDSALAEAQAKAAELRKNDTTLSGPAALQQVFKADPQLAARYQDEQRAA